VRHEKNGDRVKLTERDAWGGFTRIVQRGFAKLRKAPAVPFWQNLWRATPEGCERLQLAELEAPYRDVQLMAQLKGLLTTVAAGRAASRRGQRPLEDGRCDVRELLEELVCDDSLLRELRVVAEAKKPRFTRFK
jgi:hypothetical protein